jgi:hypothetical protein
MKYAACLCRSSLKAASTQTSRVLHTAAIRYKFDDFARR